MTMRQFVETSVSGSVSHLIVIGGEYHASRIDANYVYGVVDLDIGQTTLVGADTVFTLIPVDGIVSDSTSASPATKTAHLLALGSVGITGTDTTAQALAKAYTFFGNPFFAPTQGGGSSGGSGSGITALTGDVSASGTGSVVATIANDAVTFAKMQNIPTSTLVGRSSPGTGDPESITIGTGLSLVSGVLSVTGSVSASGSVSGGTGNPWVLNVNESGASIANWTIVSGAWSVVSSALHIDTGATTVRQLRFTARVPQTGFVLTADVQMESTGGFAADNRVGFQFNTNVTPVGGSQCVLACTGALTPASTGIIRTEQPAGVTAGPTGMTCLFSLDVYHTLKIVCVGGAFDVYVDGVYFYTFLRKMDPAAVQEHSYFTLYAFNCRADFKNIKLHNLVLPT